MTIRPDFPVGDMLAGRRVLIAVPTARLRPLLEELWQATQQLGAGRIRVTRSNGREQIRDEVSGGRITLMAPRSERARGLSVDTLIIDVRLLGDGHVVEQCRPALAAAPEPILAHLDV